ncbi:NAD-dependent epimerase/dehydratase family protein [Paenibacillus montanisoli]|uniref:NAD-dependent epimerase/dehydratase family protein n=1 Tax=Paenibacillus montanisoli TaxID=2081970 RepID=UPI001401E258|nr:NAD(P)-dependent oxidoreductase [Paenibacillus montanisoli]
MKVAVTGANGRVGKKVVQELLEHQHEVRAIDLHSWEGDVLIEHRIADITNFKQIMQAINGCDAVIHLAAIPGPRDDQDGEVFQNNVMGVYNVALACGLSGIHRLAIASSDCALGFAMAHQKINPVYLPFDENHPAAPDDGYGLSKLVGEQVAKGIAKRFGMSIASLRISAAIKPEEYLSDSFIEHTTSLKPSGNFWSYTDIRDCARAFRLAIEADLQGHEVFHIMAKYSSSAIPSQQLIDLYYPNIPLNKQYTANESFHDCSKAEKILGFVPKYRWDVD